MKLIDIPMAENDAEAKTIGEYLKKLFCELWGEGEGFSAKHPFGNSGWQYDIYAALIKAGVVDGELDEYGCVDDVDYGQADDMILKTIEDLFDSHNIIKHGYWDDCACSVCNEVSQTIYLDEYELEYRIIETDYCPECGAKMDGGVKGEL